MNGASLIRRRGSTEKGAGLVNRLMLVRIQSSALVSRWCNGQHKTLRRSWSWFDSRLRRLETWPVSVPDSMSASEAVGPGSTPGRAADHALRV